MVGRSEYDARAKREARATEAYRQLLEDPEETAMRRRLEAQKAGRKRYKGLSCHLGHDGWRYTADGRCVSCKIMRNTGQSPRRWAGEWGPGPNIKDGLPARGPGCPAPTLSDRMRLARIFAIGPSRTCVYILAPDYLKRCIDGRIDSIYCGKPSVSGKSYCDHHAALCSAGKTSPIDFDKRRRAPVWGIARMPAVVALNRVSDE